MNTAKHVLWAGGLYLAWTANFEPANWVVALLVGTTVAWLRPRTTATAGGLPWTRWLPALVTLLRYAAVLTWDMWRSGLVVARAVMSRVPDIHPAIIEVPSHCRTSLGRAWMAHSISVTPGELVVSIEGNGMLRVHSLDQRRRDRTARVVQTRAERYLRRLLPGEDAR